MRIECLEGRKACSYFLVSDFSDTPYVEVMAKQAAWEAFRSKQRQAQAEEWHQHEEALQARRRRVERGLGLDLDEAPDFAGR